MPSHYRIMARAIRLQWLATSSPAVVSSLKELVSDLADEFESDDHEFDRDEWYDEAWVGK